jgi:hypothetical protein
MQEGAVMTYFKILSWHLLSELTKNMKNITHDSHFLTGIQSHYLRNTSQKCYYSIITKNTYNINGIYLIY